jgi:hypothetical protein
MGLALRTFDPVLFTGFLVDFLADVWAITSSPTLGRADGGCGLAGQELYGALQKSLAAEPLGITRVPRPLPYSSGTS